MLDQSNALLRSVLFYRVNPFSSDNGTGCGETHLNLTERVKLAASRDRLIAYKLQSLTFLDRCQLQADVCVCWSVDATGSCYIAVKNGCKAHIMREWHLTVQHKTDRRAGNGQFTLT